MTKGTSIEELIKTLPELIARSKLLYIVNKKANEFGTIGKMEFRDKEGLIITENSIEIPMKLVFTLNHNKEIKEEIK